EERLDQKLRTAPRSGREEVVAPAALLGAVSKTKNLLSFRPRAAKTSLVLACASVSVPVGSAACATNSPSANGIVAFHKLRSKLFIQVSIADLALLIFSSVGRPCITLESAIPTMPRASLRSPSPEKFRTATR